jgi:hypothetical protein
LPRSVRELAHIAVGLCVGSHTRGRASESLRVVGGELQRTGPRGPGVGTENLPRGRVSYSAAPLPEWSAGPQLLLSSTAHLSFDAALTLDELALLEAVAADGVRSIHLLLAHEYVSTTWYSR